MKSDNETRMIPFIRTSSHGVESLAIVRCEVKPKMSQASIIQALKECLTSWMKGFDKGRAAWEQSGRDFNIGDLALCDRIFLRLYKAKLALMGIQNLQIVCVLDDIDPIPYDTILADPSELQ